MERASLRDHLAAERTLLAWLRTGLALMGFGFVVARFGLFLREIGTLRTGAVAGTGLSAWFGTALVLLGVMVNVGAARRYVRTARKIDRGEPVESVSRLGIALAVTLSAIGVAMAAYVMAFR